MRYDQRGVEEAAVAAREARDAVEMLERAAARITQHAQHAQLEAAEADRAVAEAAAEQVRFIGESLQNLGEIAILRSLVGCSALPHANATARWEPQPLA